MMKRYLALFFTAAALAIATRAYAHHSFSATYLVDESVTIEGELVQFVFRNPHSLLQLVVTEKDGAQVRYAIEWGGAGQLGALGVTREMLRPGDRLVITGNPGRNPADHKVRLVSLRRPKDGFEWGTRADQVVD